MEPELDTNQVINNLNAILEAELSGVVRYTLLTYGYWT